MPSLRETYPIKLTLISSTKKVLRRNEGIEKNFKILFEKFCGFYFLNKNIYALTHIHI